MARGKGIKGGGKTGRQIASGLEGAKRAHGTDILRDVPHPADVENFRRLAEKLRGTVIRIQQNRPFAISREWVAAKLEGNSKEKSP